MHSAILLSPDAQVRQPCSPVVAGQLLRLGLAKITKFYPYTLQLKGYQGPCDPCLINCEPKQPDPTPHMIKKSLPVEEVV